LLSMQTAELMTPASLVHLSNRSSGIGLGVGYVSYRNEYHKIFLGSRARPMREADNLTVTCETIV
jgi:hypothetical protein